MNNNMLFRTKILFRKLKQIILKNTDDITNYDEAVKPFFNNEKLINEINNIDKICSSKSKIFYLIARQPGTIGLFSYVYTSLGHIAYALAKGYIPVIDMQNYPNTYLESSKLGVENSWEYYFKQPYGYNISDLKNQRIIRSSLTVYPVLDTTEYTGKNEDFLFWSTLYQKFIVLNENTEQYINEEYTRLIKPDMRVLGVLCRGTDYTSKKPPMHPIQPSVKDVIEKAKQYMLELNCNYIYLATDEIKTLKYFEDSFPDKILTNNRKYYDNIGDNYVAEVTFNRENDKYLQGLEYLSSIVILSRCTALVAGESNGSCAALHMNSGKYEGDYIFKLGVYGKDDIKNI